MSIISNLLIRLTCFKKGTDQFGNSYFQSKKINYLGYDKRYIIFFNENEPSAIPPLYHSWLHRLTDIFPLNVIPLIWQQEYEPNQTGRLKVKNLYNRKRKIVSADYQSWNPDNKN